MKNNKIIITAAIAGLLGGGVAYGGASFVQNRMEATTTAVPTGSNKSGETQTSNVKVNVSSQSSKAFSTVKDSVVSVINLQKENNNDPDNILNSIFGDSESSSSKKSSSDKLQTASEGSGVIYKKSGDAAYIVTNNHVVSGSNSLEVIMSNGKKLPAKIVGTDSVTDLAVLKINSAPVTTVASFGDSDNIKVGETALAIGSPLGSEYATSLTQGIISAKKRSIETYNSNGQGTGEATVIQTDAAINPGNSGGPLINLAGQVIGINSMKLSSSGNSTSVEGMGFAIPSNEVVSVIDQLVKNGKIDRPALGVTLVDLTAISSDQQKSILKLPSSVTGGSVIMSVNAGPAKSAGLKKYDVVTKVDGKSVKDTAELREALYKHKVGDTIKVGYYHNGKYKTTDVKLTKTASTN
ncbi:S1C family serine protease [Lacticaseibacillus rhamnosus]|jgi:serine protease Do|uniref:S1C family serine protease n=1 Tax=Lacticaseibacillus rhamnosus TaxID=47715 RepID=UPI00066944C3|nr:trypsin-like peptidase domain-containing protein [Lacticaseibacillus rhamnosus]OFM28504.1 serine protease [Lactobacillus sp. HMSC078F07]MCZ2733965.1 trypsin-like peptidase domain-containing protein [Lacticaseibacillus rhamnosus]MCZ2736613.1 trypsin-like peptidase domain-containing protein [Lacticaseibacillus rhamnosus]MCZ2742999.1 trypsin-like peptidase domain-containing protein [Lacticaseibacillus rhamnosus]MCZ2745694.1 trypsin-like peptidase domain-containing protein [Lacticaseibacillus r